MDELEDKVRMATIITDEIREHMDYQAMYYYLQDWLNARDVLDRRISELHRMRKARAVAVEEDEWP